MSYPDRKLAEAIIFVRQVLSRPGAGTHSDAEIEEVARRVLKAIWIPYRPETKP